MANTVTYSVVPRKKPGKNEDPVKFYAQAQASGEMGVLEICERLQRECTLTRADVMAVLVALEDVVADGIRGGQIVRLGGLCSLQISLSSSGVLNEADYTETNITKSRILFRSGNTLRGALMNLAFKKVPKKPKKTDNAPSERPEVQV